MPRDCPGGAVARRWRGSLRNMTERVQANRRISVLQIFKTSLAAVLAWVVANPMSDEPPIFAVIAALLVVQPSVNQSLTRGIERSLGAVLGVVVATLIGVAFGDAQWAVLLATVLAILIAWSLRLSTATTNQVPISAMLVLALGAGALDYSVLRIVETIVGAAIAFAVNLIIVPPVPYEAARREVVDFAEHVAKSFEQLADACIGAKGAEHPELVLVEARLLRNLEDRALEAVEDAEESLTLNPRAKGKREGVAMLRRSVDDLGSITAGLIGMARAFRDHYNDSLTSEPMMVQVATEMRRIAHDLRMYYVAGNARAGEPGTDTQPLLTTPIVTASPSGTNWMLMGSLLEDLRRIHLLVQEEAA